MRLVGAGRRSQGYGTGQAAQRVLIDGLDEVPRAFRGDLDRDIAHLGRHLTNGKIIVSCRSADYVAPLPGFQTAEIRPLGADQIKGLVRGLLRAEAAAFYQDLSSHPAADVADRPLFLTYMAAIYRQRGSIPADALVRGPAATRADWWKTFPAVAAVSVAMSSDPNCWLHELIDAMPRNLDDIRPLQVFLDRLGQERPRFTRSAVLGGDLLHLVERGHIDDAAPVARLGGMPAVRDSVADALGGFERLTVAIGTTRAASYPPRSALPSKALQVPTPVMVALVGEERLRQIERSKAKRSQLGG
jgi:hypothetical protein